MSCHEGVVTVHSVQVAHRDCRKVDLNDGHQTSDIQIQMELGFDLRFVGYIVCCDYWIVKDVLHRGVNSLDSK